ncbi:DUF4363 family protein [Clostridium sp. 'deep sea']|uniref:DUF4363 family protein n=1 Tax=Clostridium sp. 'deep sea' TaxID=2779445 RepID=UPI0018967453|nr:DUF4363 family protein [Clostridium sp. 'deep sea']QOR35933.1 DUF4363 family protein [Clostridium sp. 'deep sea']
MKSLYIGLVLIIIVYGLGIYMSHILNTYLNEAYDIVIEIENATDAEDWTTVKQKIAELTAMWPDKHTRLAYFIDHDELDKIEIAIAKIDGENILNDKYLLFPELVSLRKILEQVRGKYEFRLSNIV